MKHVFNDYDMIIGIMAAGILIRNICKNISNKYTDPGVLLIDEKGNFVISLLSGHIGGANQFTKKIANLLSSDDIITTSTDVHNKIGIDTLANHLYLNIKDKKKVLTFNKALLKNEILHLKSNSKTIKYIEKFFLNNTLEIIDDENQYSLIENINNHIKNKYNYTLNIDETINSKIIAKFQDIELELKPRKLVVGIGSRKNISEEKVLLAINTAIKNLGVSLNRINCLATASIKKDELGIFKASETLNKPLIIIEKDKIEEFYSNSHSKDCLKSIFVKEKFGIEGVSEACALISSGKDSKLIHKKMALNGVTVAVAISKQL
jgi:cobalt-precorrin 5A hydrolase